MPTRRNCFYLFVGLMLLLSSCTPRFFYPSRINYYSFDTCRQLEFEGEVFVAGASGSVAFSPINHFAIALGGNIQGTSQTIIFNSEPIQSSASQYDLSIGYFNKITPEWGFDLFGGLGHQHVTGTDSVITVYSTTYDPNSYYGRPFDKEFYLFSLQPSLYYTSKKYPHFAIGCKISKVYGSYDTEEFEYNSIAVLRRFKYEDMLFEPGIEFSLAQANWITVGLYGHFSLNDKLENNYNLKPLTFALKLTPKFRTSRIKNFIHDVAK